MYLASCCASYWWRGWALQLAVLRATWPARRRRTTARMRALVCWLVGVAGAVGSIGEVAVTKSAIRAAARRARPTPSDPIAFVVVVCNASLIRSRVDADLRRATAIAQHLRLVEESDVVPLALVANLDRAAKATLRAAGWMLHDASGALHTPLMQPLFSEVRGHHWPGAGIVQRRPDHACTSLKLLAWNLTQYRSVLLSDLDVCLLEDPAPWMRAHADEYFVASQEPFGRWPNSRKFLGLNSHLCFLQPSTLLFRLLRDKGQTRSYIPYTNGEQDIIETVFADHARWPPLPRHTHKCGWRACVCEDLRKQSPSTIDGLVAAATYNAAREETTDGEARNISARRSTPTRLRVADGRRQGNKGTVSVVL